MLLHGCLNTNCPTTPLPPTVQAHIADSAIAAAAAAAATAALLQPGTYQLTNTVPAPTSFSHWECYNTTSGVATTPINSTNITLAVGTSWTCVATFVMLPQPKLALLSRYVGANYTGPTANLTATGPSNCTEAPSTALGGAANVTAPGAGLCNSNGTLLVRVE
jgi:hypothetical protein